MCCLFPIFLGYLLGLVFVSEALGLGLGLILFCLLIPRRGLVMVGLLLGVSMGHLRLKPPDRPQAISDEDFVVRGVSTKACRVEFSDIRGTWLISRKLIACDVGLRGKVSGILKLIPERFGGQVAAVGWVHIRPETLRWHEPHPLERALQSFRARVREFLNRGPPLQTGLRRALIMGEGDGIDRSQWRDFNQLGLSHLIVISGSHISFLLLIFGVVLRPLAARGLRGSRQRLLRILVLGGVSSLLLVCDFGISLQRALGVYVLAQLLPLGIPSLSRYSSVDRLGLVGLVFGLICPSEVCSLSGVLSFLAAATVLKSRGLAALWLPSLASVAVLSIWGRDSGISAPTANVLMAPLFGLIVFPLSLTSAVLPPLEAFTEILVERTLEWTSLLAEASSAGLSTQASSLSSWLLLAATMRWTLKLRESARDLIFILATYAIFGAERLGFLKVDFDISPVLSYLYG